MKFTFNALAAQEHENGAYLGTFTAPNYGTVEYSYFFKDSDYFRFNEDMLYLGSDWHGDFETGEIKKYNSDKSYTYRSIEKFPIKLTELGSGNTTWEYINLRFRDIDEAISVTPVSFEAYEHGAVVAKINSDLDSYSYDLNNNQYFEVSGQYLKIRDNFYYDPQQQGFYEGTKYFSPDLERKYSIYSHSDAEGTINFIDSFILSEVLSKVVVEDVPFFAGTAVIEKPKSGISNTDALLFDDNKLWSSNPKYMGDTTKTVITFSFIPDDSSLQKFAEYYYAPDPKTDKIIGFEERHKVAARQALDEWAKVANIQFVELDETTGSYGTIRFGFTDHDKGDNTAAWATTPGSTAKSGDIWITKKEMPDPFVKGTSYNFSTLLHEIGHALGLEHPFEGSDIIDSSLDFSNYTLMSYADPEGARYYDNEGNYQYLISSTPMLYDIAAIQYLYGTAKNNEGNTTYTYDPNQPFVEAIWDTSGYDTVDLRSFSEDCTINIFPGNYSTIACDDWSMDDNLGIAQGVTLEKVMAGSGNDIIIGNSADNHLIGNSGSDTISGGDGNDRIEGGKGNDTLRGGSGADIFKFKEGDGTNVIADFRLGEDTILFFNSDGSQINDRTINYLNGPSGATIGIISPSSDISVTVRLPNNLEVFQIPGGGSTYRSSDDLDSMIVARTDVSSEYTPIIVYENGSGSVLVESSYNIKGGQAIFDQTLNRDGIYIRGGENAADLYIKSRDVSGLDDGIVLVNNGKGISSIAIEGNVTSRTLDRSDDEYSYAILCTSEGKGIDISVNGNVSSNDRGIFAWNSGSGDTVISVSRDVSALNYKGIYADNNELGSEAKDINISVHNVLSFHNTVTAINNEQGKNEINITGFIESLGSDHLGICSRKGFTELNVTSSATVKAYTGISTDDYADNVTIDGIVIALGGNAIETFGSNDTLTLGLTAKIIGLIHGGAGSDTVNFAISKSDVENFEYDEAGNSITIRTAAESYNLKSFEYIKFADDQVKVTTALSVDALTEKIANRTSLQDKLNELQEKYNNLMEQYNATMNRVSELEAQLSSYTSTPFNSSQPATAPATWEPELEPTPAPDIELTLAEVERAPTGISKILVEKYGYSWIDGKYYSKGTAPEVNLDGDAIHTVTVSKVGNQNEFFIDGNSNPDFVVEAGKTYRFDQSDASNANHPLNFLSKAGSDVTSYVEISGNAGSEGAYVELYFDTNDISNIDGPELSYYCEIHGATMGNDIEVSNIIA